MPEIEIPKLEQLLLPKFLGENKKIESYNTKNLTAPGENYGSIMLQVDITTIDQKTKEVNVINAVGKLIPNNEFIRKAFNIDTTFPKELAIYTKVIPLLKQFQKEQGDEDLINFIPEFYGGRLSLDDPEKFDYDGAILLENLKPQGFINVERTLGFDLETSKFILKDLAHLHAISIALKQLKPEVYNKEVLPFLSSLKQMEDVDNQSFLEKGIEEFIKYSKEDPDCGKYAEQMSKALRNDPFSKLQTSEHYKALNHCDFWVNNTMIKFQNGRPIANKMVDFQIVDEHSVANDLTFFLFSSVQNEVLEEYFDELVEEYHKNLIEKMKKLGADTTCQTRELLEEEMKIYMKSNGFTHCIFMLQPIFAKKENTRAVEDLSMELFFEKRDVTIEYKRKQWMIMKELIKRNWI